MSAFLCHWARVLFFLLVSIAAIPVSAQPNSKLESIAFEKGWLALLHYERSATSATGWKSAIHSPEFFLSANGVVDPLAELQATYDAISEPLSIKPDSDLRCRFPARIKWLTSRLDIRQENNLANTCPTLNQWMRSGSISSLSVVFATGYLGNPATYYGHILLKFNPAEYGQHTNLMDTSVNFGVIHDGSDNLPSYITKAILGGYDGGFSHINFYFHTHNYGENELRDLWEYKLNLPQDAVDMIIAHTWEVLGKHYTYYFFRRNCAYRMAEILQIIDGLDIMPENSPWIIPQAMIQKLNKTNYKGKPLVAEVIYHPSRQSRFYEKFLSLSSEEVQLTRGIAEGHVAFEDQIFRERPVSSMHAVLDTLFDYYQYTAATNTPGYTSKEYLKALSLRYQLPPGVREVVPKKPDPPDRGRPPGWLQASLANNSAIGTVGMLRVRPAYYDVLDADSGHVMNAALSMGDIQIAFQNSHAYLNKLDALSIKSVNPGLSRLPNDKGHAWKLRIGAEQARLFCTPCLAAHAQGDIGYGRQWAKNIFGAVYLGGSLQQNSYDQGVGYARASADVIISGFERFSMRISIEQRYPFQKQPSYSILLAEARWPINRTSDFRIKYDHDKVNSLEVGIGLYW